MAEESLPPGFRFHPTDDELVSFYLTHKIADTSFTCKAIVAVDLNKNEPWDLPGKASMGEKEWYFFSLRDRKYPTGLRTNRATEAGYWKTTGKDKEIFSATSGALVGMKKTLVFYKGRAPRGEKSNWVMHEYRLENKHRYKSVKEEWVVCRIFQKTSSLKKPQLTSSSQQSYDDTNSIANNNNNIDHFGDLEFSNLNGGGGGYNDDVVSANYHHHHHTAINIHDLHHHNNNNTLLHMNQAPSSSSLLLNSSLLPWPATASNLLGGASNLAVNNLLLKAMQLRNYQQREAAAAAAAADYNSMLSHDHHQLGASFQASSSSSSRVLETAPQQQQQLMAPQPDEEQPFNMDSAIINWS
ncbi:unnamed protein product [Linum trigynum]|uniref:NAC domain-containing protein n=1 Tax=Linum trigynum TaxID=586398 RepID=A0AAV2DCS4_9ROSI